MPGCASCSEENLFIGTECSLDGKIKNELVDKAIEAIKASGFNCRVGPFETVVECSYEELPELLEKVHEASCNAGTERMLPT